MDRLTKDQIYLNSIMFGIQCNFIPVCGEERTKEVTDFLKKVFKKLAEYEDSEEQGRLIEVVKCKDCVKYYTDDPTIVYWFIKYGDYIDKFKIGKMNYHPSNINWKEFGYEAEKLCKQYERDYYIKEDLRKEMDKEVSQ